MSTEYEFEVEGALIKIRKTRNRRRTVTLVAWGEQRSTVAFLTPGQAREIATALIFAGEEAKKDDDPLV